MVSLSWCIIAIIRESSTLLLYITGMFPFGLWANEIIDSKGLWGGTSSFTERNKHDNMNEN